jgi:hypothetical protein
MDFTFSELLQIVTLVTLLAGLIFGILEISRARRDRFEKGAVDVLGSAVHPDHIRASYAILDLPEAASPELICESSDHRAAANTLILQYEYPGNLVYQGIVPLHTIDLLVGGVIRACWKRLGQYIEDQRPERDLANIGEQFQWLAERLEEYGRPDKALGAHVAFKGWEP